MKRGLLAGLTLLHAGLWIACGTSGEEVAPAPPAVEDPDAPFRASAASLEGCARNADATLALSANIGERARFVRHCTLLGETETPDHTRVRCEQACIVVQAGWQATPEDIAACPSVCAADPPE